MMAEKCEMQPMNECEWEHYNNAFNTDIDCNGVSVHVTVTLNCIHCDREIQTDYSLMVE